jgi:hypothetical protein
MALPSSGNITLSAIQTEFSAANLRAAATAAGVAANMRAFLGLSSFTATLYDYQTAGSYTWTNPGAKNITAVCCAGGGGGGGSDGQGGQGGGGGGGMAYFFAYSVSGISSLTLVVGAGGAQRPNGLSQGNSGNTSSMAITSGATLVSCVGGEGGYPGLSQTNGAGGRSGKFIFNGNTGVGNGAPGNPYDTSSPPGGGGGDAGDGGVGINYYGGDGSSYTINGVANNYGAGGGGGSYNGSSLQRGTGTGGHGRDSLGGPGNYGNPGRIVFYATP